MSEVHDDNVQHSLVGGGVLRYFATNPVAANLLMAILLVGGFVAAYGITAQSFPTIDLGTINVTVPSPGATPSEVEESITRRIEEAVIGIDGVKRVTSRAYENSGAVSIELKTSADKAKVRDDVETAIERLADFPPERAEEPDIVRLEKLPQHHDQKWAAGFRPGVFVSGADSRFAPGSLGRHGRAYRLFWRVSLF